MKPAANGNNVSVHYRGTFDDGTVFDSSYDKGEPITFEVGSTELIAGFSEAVVGMNPGETRSISLAPEDAYGPAIPEAVQKVPRTAFGEGFPLNEGVSVQGTAPNGQTMVGVVNSIEEDHVVVDFNHPMAGKNLNFQIQLVSVNF